MFVITEAGFRTDIHIIVLLRIFSLRFLRIVLNLSYFNGSCFPPKKVHLSMQAADRYSLIQARNLLIHCMYLFYHANLIPPPSPHPTCKQIIFT